MQTSEQKVQSELLSGMEMFDQISADPTNCPACRSGVVEIPPAIMADVVNVEL